MQISIKTPVLIKDNTGVKLKIIISLNLITSVGNQMVYYANAPTVFGQYSVITKAILYYD
jgi:hypothetical protein